MIAPLERSPDTDLPLEATERLVGLLVFKRGTGSRYGFFLKRHFVTSGQGAGPLAAAIQHEFWAEPLAIDSLAPADPSDRVGNLRRSGLFFGGGDAENREAFLLLICAGDMQPPVIVLAHGANRNGTPAAEMQQAGGDRH